MEEKKNYQYLNKLKALYRWLLYALLKHAFFLWKYILQSIFFFPPICTAVSLTSTFKFPYKRRRPHPSLAAPLWCLKAGAVGEAGVANAHVNNTS